MRYRLRTLLILLEILPPVLAMVGISVFHLRQQPPSAAGTVTYRGMPVAKGIVEFVPESSDGQRHTARTDERGCYSLNGARTSPPLKPGRYRVTIAFPGQAQQLQVQLVADLQTESENRINFELQ